MSIQKYTDDLFVGIANNKKVQRFLSPFIDEDSVIFEFKKKYSLKDRIIMYKELKLDHPSKIPVIIECDGYKKILKLMVEWDEKAMRLFINIRSNYNIPINKAIFLVTDEGKVLMGSQCIGDIFRDHRFKTEDMFLYLKVEHENTFG